MGRVNPLVLRTALLTGLVIGAVNIVFAGVEYGFATLPIWFYLVQLLLLPAMLFPTRLFPQAATTRAFAQRAGLYALGWAAPYAVYTFSSDALNIAFDPARTLLRYLLYVAIFGLVFAYLRAPKEK